MNKQRRKAIEKLSADLASLVAAFEAANQANTASIDFGGAIEDCTDLESDEQEYFDNMPESLQSGEKGESAEAAIGALSSAKDALEEALEAYENLIEHIQNAMSALEEAKAA